MRTERRAPREQVDPRPAVDVLRSLLGDRGVPPSRIDLAARATESLLRNAVTKRADGTVYVVTGDIPAMWLRDSCAQVRPLLALAHELPELVDLVAGVLRLQVEQVLIDPRANAFNPGPTGAHLRRDFHDQSPWVFERKYATDSLCAPLLLAWLVWHATSSLAHVDGRFIEAARSIVSLWRSEQDHDYDSYRFRRRLARRRGVPSRRGRGARVARTGMTWSAFRPSDDACRYGYHVPANAFAAVSLEQLDAVLRAAHGDLALAADAQALAAEIRAGIAAHGVAADSSGTPIYAYEVDGLGGALLLDDANSPSLLSLPYLGFCDARDPLYRSTRSWLLGPGNPNWVRGVGVGSGHTRRGWVWPLAIAMEGLTAIDADEREQAARRIEATVTGELLFHESVDPANPRRFTRRWFSWADMLYVELVLATAGISPPEMRAPPPEPPASQSPG
jgi:meiotically up-regulated gene 157 (Mug157) protein